MRSAKGQLIEYCARPPTTKAYLSCHAIGQGHLTTAATATDRAWSVRNDQRKSGIADRRNRT